MLWAEQCPAGSRIGTSRESNASARQKNRQVRLHEQVHAAVRLPGMADEDFAASRCSVMGSQHGSQWRQSGPRFRSGSG
jgi:hypothetical protein